MGEKIVALQHGDQLKKWMTTRLGYILQTPYLYQATKSYHIVSKYSNEFADLEQSKTIYQIQVFVIISFLVSFLFGFSLSGP